MPTYEYQFATRWLVEGTPEEVFAVLDEPEDMARWWSSVYLDVRWVEPGYERGIGKVVALLTKGWLPYKIRWSFRVTEKDKPTRIALVAWGFSTGTESGRSPRRDRKSRPSTTGVFGPTSRC